MPPHDPFAGFGRVRRSGFSPRVDVAYAPDPPRALVTVELAGVAPADVDLEVRGRELVISGRRGPVDDTQGRVFQQIEIEHGAFRRTVPLGADVEADAARATYDNGILRVELPLVQPEARSRTVPVEVRRR